MSAAVMIRKPRAPRKPAALKAPKAPKPPKAPKEPKPPKTARLKPPVDLTLLHKGLSAYWSAGTTAQTGYVGIHGWVTAGETTRRITAEADHHDRQAREWLVCLGEQKRLEFGALLHAARSGSDRLAVDAAADWVEEHGGRRTWYLSRRFHFLTQILPQHDEVDRWFHVGDTVAVPAAKAASAGASVATVVGTVTSVGPKTISVREAGGKNRRLTPAQFVASNWNFRPQPTA